MMQETIVRLRIVSEVCTPEMVASVTGLPGDRCWHIGDTRPHTIIKERVHGWILNSGLPRSAGLEEQIRSIQSVLKPHVAAVKSLSDRAEIEFSCVIYATAEPGLYFDAAVIRWLERLGASLDIDQYMVDDDFFNSDEVQDP